MEEDPLDEVAQKNFITENNGVPVPYKRRGADSADANALIMEATPLDVENQISVSFLVGIQTGVRTITGYDATQHKRTKSMVADHHIKCGHVVIIPSLGIMAVRDRANDGCISQRTTLGIFRAIVRGFGGDLAVIHLKDKDVRHAVETWELTEYHYTVRPLNPIKLSDLTNLRSDAMKKENIGRETAHLKAVEGTFMKANQGTISQTQEMVDVGYGQNGFRGFTPDGHLAHVPKAAFHMNRKDNLREREKPRFMRVMFDDADGGESAIAASIASSLIRFYHPPVEEKGDEPSA